MSRTDTRTKLPLARWAQIMGINPLHFEQVQLATFPPSVCGQPWLQHAWQDADRIGREDLAIAIRDAEDEIERELKARLMPSWEVDEWNPTVRAFRPELINLTAGDIRGFSQIAQLKWMHLVTGGIEAKELVGAGEAIVYSDENGDSYNETATVTRAVTFTDPCEVAIFYPGKAGDEVWEIRPIEVSIAAGIATITFRRELAVLEDLMEQFDPSGLEGEDDANFLTTVDVYRHYNDPQRQVQFLWEPFNTSCPSCTGTGCAACGYSTQEGCLMAREDPRLSIVSYHPATWNTTDLDFDAVAYAVGRQPDLLRLWYYAGLRDPTRSCSYRNMPQEWERVVAYFAAAKLDRPLCECNNVGAFTEHWRKDLSIRGEEDQFVSDITLENPFGTQRGAVHAWQRVLRAREIGTLVAI